MSVEAKKRSAMLGVVAVVLAAGSGAWLWLDKAWAQEPEAPPVMACKVVAAGVAVLDANGSDAVVGQPAIGVASAGGVTGHFGALHCLVQHCGDAPQLISVFPSVPKPEPDRYVFPYAPSVGVADPDRLRFVDVLLNDVVNIDSICIKSTGGAPPASALLNDINGAGLYELEFSAPVELGEWTTVVMTVTNPCGVTDVCIHVGWLPGDVTQDAQLNLNDATQFGVQFNLGVNAENKLADFNADDQVNINDATEFGQIWNGTDGEHNPDTGLGWLGVGLGPLPDCTCP